MKGSRAGPLVGAGFSLWRVAMRWQRAVDEGLAPLGLTHTRYLLLATTARLTVAIRGAVSQAEIGRAAGIDPAGTSRLVTILEKQGLVSRARDATGSARCQGVLCGRSRDAGSDRGPGAPGRAGAGARAAPLRAPRAVSSLARDSRARPSGDRRGGGGRSGTHEGWCRPGGRRRGETGRSCRNPLPWRRPGGCRRRDRRT